MNRLLVIAVVLLACAACSSKPKAPVRSEVALVPAPAAAGVGSTPAPAPASAPARPHREASAPAESPFARDVNPIVDVVPARAPSTEMPKGTVFVGAVSGGQGGKARVAEWDVARARPLKTIELEAGDSPQAVRLAVTADRVFAVVDHWPSPVGVRVVALDHQLAQVGVRTLGRGTDVSLDASGDWVVVSARGPEDIAPLTVTLLSSRSLDKRAEATLGAPEMLTPLVRPRLVALHAGRVYVGARRPVSKLDRDSSTGAVSLPPITLFALEIPSLRIVATRATNASSHYPPFVTSRGGRLFAELDGEVTELTRDLGVVKVRPAGFGGSTIGPDGALAASRCLEPAQEGMRCPRDEPVDDGASSCVTAWPHDQPLLVCGGASMRIEPIP